MARTPDAAAPTGPRLNLPIFALALFGVLVVTHLWVQQDANFVYGCTGAGTAASGSGCAAVTSSIYSTFLGVSLLVWGALFYLALAALRFGVAVAKPPTSDHLRTASLAVASAGFLFALYLVSVQIFQLGQFCVLCLVSSVTVAVLFALHVVERVKGPGPAVAVSAALAPYAIAAVALVVLAGADVLLLGSDDALTRSPIVATQNETATNGVSAALAAGGLSADCHYDLETPRLRDFDRLITMETPYEGDPNGEVRILKIFDPNCPHCRTLHRQLQQIIPQVENAKFYYEPSPIWDFSVPQAQALYLAGEEGKFFQMLDLQFAAQQQGGLSLDQIVSLGERIGMDGEDLRQEIEARKYLGLIRSDRQIVEASGLRSVPKVVIEGRVVANTGNPWTAECINGLVELAAQEKAAAAEASANPADTSATVAGTSL